MNKKILTIILVVLLAMANVFAYRGEVKIGANLGAGADGWGKSIDEDHTDVLVQGGVYAAGVVSYGLSDTVYLKSELGINTFSKFVRSTTGSETATGSTNRTPIGLLSVAAVYNIPIGRILDINLQAGIDSSFGKASYGSERPFNISIGLGLGAEFAFNITDEMAITLNSKLAFYFFNTDSTYRNSVSANNVILVGAQNNIGITYSL